MSTATVTLSTTTLSQPCLKSDNQLTLGSLTGVTAGLTCLFVDKELIGVMTIGLGTVVNVRRGIGGTIASRHQSNATVYLGRPDQFYDFDPVGLPAPQIPVTPHINVINGVMWVAQGDEDGPGLGARVWAQVTTTMAAGDLGVRVVTTTTPS